MMDHYGTGKQIIQGMAISQGIDYNFPQNIRQIAQGEKLTIAESEERISWQDGTILFNIPSR